MTSRTPTLRSFLFLAYALTWVMLGPWFYAFNVVYHERIPGWMWAFAPVAFIGGWGPSIAALIVTFRAGGRPAVRRLAGPLVVWQVPVRWYLIVFALPPLVTALSFLVVDRGPTTLLQFNLGAALVNMPVAYALALPFGPLGEELGWRGFALPRLLSRFGPVAASLLLGGAWTFWHIPMMLFSPGASLPSFMTLSVTAVLIYLVQLTALTALMTFLFLRTNGSVLLAVLAHLTFNSAENVVSGGLPHQVTEHLRRVYLVDVGLLAVLGLISLVVLATAPRRKVAAS